MELNLNVSKSNTFMITKDIMKSISNNKRRVNNTLEKIKSSFKKQSKRKTILSLNKWSSIKHIIMSKRKWKRR